MPDSEAAPHDRQFGATIARHFSLWPFGTRTLRLYLLVDPSLPEVGLVRALLHGMAHEYFRVESGSQTRAVRSALLGAHFVLRHYNRGALPHAQASAAAIVAAARGQTAYAALSGEVAAFSWSAGVLDGQHPSVGVGRPLGTEHEPRVTLWSAPFGPADRLVLACGVAWHDDTLATVREVLSSTPTELAAARLADALAGSRGPARVMVADGVPCGARRAWAPRAHIRHVPRRRHGRLAALPAMLLLLAAVLGVSFANRLSEPRPLVQDNITWVAPRLLVRLGAAAANVVDLAVSADAIYTLDVVEGTVRGFELDVEDQQPTPDTVVLRQGARVGGRALDALVAMEYVRDADTGSLVVVDRDRRVVQIQRGALSMRPLPSSRGWQRLMNLASDPQGNLYVVDGQARQLLTYPGAASQVADPPRVLLDSRTPVPFERVAGLLARDDLVLVLDDGRVARFDRQGQELPFTVRPPDGLLGPVLSVTSDPDGDLFLADPGQYRVLETRADGRFVRQLRGADLAGIRVLHTSVDGRQLYALGQEGVLAIHLPPP